MFRVTVLHRLSCSSISKLTCVLVWLLKLDYKILAYSVITYVLGCNEAYN